MWLKEALLFSANLFPELSLTHTHPHEVVHGETETSGENTPSSATVFMLPLW